MSAIHWRMAASMKVPPKRKGNTAPPQTKKPRPRLNESPSEKEGKYRKVLHARPFYSASMKVPPKRKGNPNFSGFRFEEEQASMKVPPKRKGNFVTRRCKAGVIASMKVPPKRKGNIPFAIAETGKPWASMKVPPKRKGNIARSPVIVLMSTPQ